MKKLLFVFVAVAVISVFFVACKDKESGAINPIEVKNVFGNKDEISKISNVEAQAFYYDYEVDDYYSETIASCDYKNGFKLKLQNTLSDEFLYYFWEDDDEFLGKITISDTTAKVGEIEIVALDNTGEEIGGFSFEVERYINGELYYGYAYYVYADKDFTIKGKYEDNEYKWKSSIEFNCSFKEGWNIICIEVEESDITYIEKVKITTTKPSGNNWVWRYYSWDDDWFKSTTYSKRAHHSFKNNFLRK